MPKNTTLVLLIWNVLLSALLGWSLLSKPAATVAEPGNANVIDQPGIATEMPRDSSALRNARIAYFVVDSLRNQLDLLKENKSSLASEETRLQSKIDKEMDRAQRRSQELMTKDRTYSTKSEMEADEREMMKLEGDMRQLAAESEERLMRMGENMAVNFSRELQAFLEEYNATAGFDYIISVEPGGQVWVGNRDLDLTDVVVAGMNRRHQAAKTK